MGCHTNDGILRAKTTRSEDDCSSAHRFFTSQVFISIAKSLNSVIPSGAHGKTLHASECSARSRGTPPQSGCSVGVPRLRACVHFSDQVFRGAPLGMTG